MREEINNSIQLIKKRIREISSIDKDYKDKIIPEKYYIGNLKLNLIEIGEESKNLNNFIEKIKKKKDLEISDAYNFRISLTNYYKEMDKRKILKFKKDKFSKFAGKIKEFEKEFGGKKVK